MDSEDSQTNFHENRRMKMDVVKIVNKINKEHGTIKNVYFLACGGSLVDLYPGYYFVRAESAVMDAQWIPAREFALTPPKKLGKDSLLIICSHKCSRLLYSYLILLRVIGEVSHNEGIYK